MCRFFESCLLLLACSNAAAADETLSSAYKGTAAEKLINGLKKARGTDAEEEQRVRQSPESPKEQEALVAALLVELKTAKISSELIAKIDGLKHLLHLSGRPDTPIHSEDEDEDQEDDDAEEEEDSEEDLEPWPGCGLLNKERCTKEERLELEAVIALGEEKIKAEHAELKKLLKTARGKHFQLVEGLKKRYVQEEAKHSAAVVVLQALFDASEAEKKKRAGELTPRMKLLRNSLPPGSIPYADEEYWEEYWDDEDDDDWDDDELWKEEEEEFQAWRKHTQLTLLPRLSETEARVRWEARKQKVEAEAVATKEEEFQAWRKQKQPGSFVSGLSEAEARQKHAALRDLQLKVAIKLGESEELEEELKEFEKERRRWVARGDVNKKIADLKLQVPVTEAELEEAEDALEDLEEELEEEEKTDGDDSYGDDDDYEDDDESDDDDEDLYGDKLTPQEGLAPGTGKCEADSNENCSGWAAAGECEANPQYMLERCCASCSGTGKCEADSNENCSGWAAAGECEANPQYMLEHCCASCSSRIPATASSAPTVLSRSSGVLRPGAKHRKSKRGEAAPDDEDMMKEGTAHAAKDEL